MGHTRGQPRSALFVGREERTEGAAHLPESVYVFLSLCVCRCMFVSVCLRVRLCGVVCHSGVRVRIAVENAEIAGRNHAESKLTNVHPESIMVTQQYALMNLGVCWLEMGDKKTAEGCVCACVSLSVCVCLRLSVGVCIVCIRFFLRVSVFAHHHQHTQISRSCAGELPRVGRKRRATVSAKALGSVQKHQRQPTR